MARNLRPTEVRVPCRISFAHFIDVDKNGFYSGSLLIPKTDTKTLTAINAAIDAAIQEGKSKLGNKDGYVNKKMLKFPLGRIVQRLLLQRYGELLPLRG